MEDKDFTCSITANISAADAIKKISEIPKWWGVNFKGSANEQGDEFVITMSGDSFFNYTVTELVPGKKVVWLCTDCNMPWYNDKKEWAGTKQIFELTENKGETAVNFTHEGLTPKSECYKDCEPGWTHWITASLYSYLTTGEGKFRQPTK